MEGYYSYKDQMLTEVKIEVFLVGKEAKKQNKNIAVITCCLEKNV